MDVDLSSKTMVVGAHTDNSDSLIVPYANCISIRIPKGIKGNSIDDVVSVSLRGLLT